MSELISGKKSFDSMGEVRRATGGSGDEPSVHRLPGKAELDQEKFARRRRVTDIVLAWGTPLLFLLAWEYASRNGLLDKQFWPAPFDVVKGTWIAIETGYLPGHLLDTARRLLLGFASGAVLGIVVGLLLGTVRAARVALDPLISAFYTVPKLAIFPLLMLLFGIGDTPKIILTAMSVFFIVAISTLAAIVGIPAAMHEPMRSFGATRMQTFRHLTLPAILPEVWVSLRLGAGMAVLVLVGIEMIQGSSGLGYIIWSSWQVFDVERMYVGIIVSAVFGVFFQWLITRIGRMTTPWVGNSR
ncbi:ABC transporter permease [Paenarthrobacter nitroguajacolicus]|uniref:ABC transporter permease n=1 Tax=Paenarthrobacter nitroguajacolicus TaxID=211146 RepID=UPI0015C077B2|nr:ABC transporter permease [Paenarthrobacter nitroguajacolicus]NWL10303.1 ABC transporter permease [Paenarthrobacter nitroguajacolicus]